MAKGKGKKRKKKPEEAKVRKIHDLAKTEGQEYAIVIQLLGHRRVKLKCMDGAERLGRIRGNSKKKRIFINLNDYVLIGLRDWQDEKADILDKYTEAEVKRLRRVKELPSEHVQTIEDIGFDFDDI